MKTTPVEPEDLRGVFAVPPLARSKTARRALDFEQNDLIIRHTRNGGITRFLDTSSAGTATFTNKVATGTGFRNRDHPYYVYTRFGLRTTVA